MSNHRSRIDRSTAERLLRGEAVGPKRLTGLLAATVIPGGDRELAGEEAATAAFRHAHLVPAAQRRRRSVIKTALTKLVTFKMAAVALTATAAGGTALAAGTGHLPGSRAGTTPIARATPGHHSDGHATVRGRHPGAPASPSLAGLCHAYRAGAGTDPGKALANPAFTHLIAVAGGKDKVAAYCAELVRTSDGRARDAHPTGASTAHGKSAGAEHRSGAPRQHPTGAPTRRPGGPSSRTGH